LDGFHFVQEDTHDAVVGWDWDFPVMPYNRRFDKARVAQPLSNYLYSKTHFALLQQFYFRTVGFYGIIHWLVPQLQIYPFATAL